MTLKGVHIAQFVASFPNSIINYTTVFLSFMDQMDDDESWQKGVSILVCNTYEIGFITIYHIHNLVFVHNNCSLLLCLQEKNGWNIFSDFDMNSTEEEDTSVDHAEGSWKESTTTLLSNFASLEENTGFDDMPILTQHASPQFPKSCVLSFEGSTSVPTKKTCHHLGEDKKQTQNEKPHYRKPLKRERTSSQTVDHIIAERKRRENITTLFIALSALIPGLKKVSSYVFPLLLSTMDLYSPSYSNYFLNLHSKPSHNIYSLSLIFKP